MNFKSYRVKYYLLQLLRDMSHSFALPHTLYFYTLFSISFYYILEDFETW